MTKARRRAHSGECCELPVRPMKSQQRIEIHIGHTVAPGQHEGAFTHPGSEALNAPAGCGAFTRFHQIDRPVNVVAIMQDDVASTGLDRHVALQCAEITHPALDIFALVP